MKSGSRFESLFTESAVLFFRFGAALLLVAGVLGTRATSSAPGTEPVNLANGMTDIHTPEERIAVADLREMVDVTLALAEVPGDAA